MSRITIDTNVLTAMLFYDVLSFLKITFSTAIKRLFGFP